MPEPTGNVTLRHFIDGLLMAVFVCIRRLSFRRNLVKRLITAEFSQDFF